MTTEIHEKAQDDTEGSHQGDDAGRERMVWNVLASWGGYAVVVVAGFIMPRFIDRRMGQDDLGVWDFAWSLLSYFALVEMGIGFSVQRYVAKHRAAQDVEGLRCAVSSVMCVQVVAALIVLLATAAMTWALPSLFGRSLGVRTDAASTVVALLGTSLAVQMAFGVFRGVITGCHRWDLHNGIQAGFHAATVAGMIAAISLGYGLKGLALVNLCGVVATELTRRSVAYRVCPEMRIRLAYVRWPQMRRMLAFGGKSSIHTLGLLVLFQGNYLLVMSQLGPAALALYARPGALVRHVETFVNKFAHVLTPAASSLQARGRDADLRQLLMESTRFATGLALPLFLVLAILGAPILDLWMGPRYEQGLVLAILAVGYLLPVSQQPAVTILTGLNLHGRVGVINLGVALVGVALGIIAMGVLQWKLVGAALALVLPLMIGDGILIPLYACRRLGVSFTEYLRRAFLGPIVCAIPFALCLVAIRVLFGGRPLVALGSAFAAGVVVLGPLYWRYLVPQAIREEVLSLKSRIFGRAGLLRT